MKWAARVGFVLSLSLLASVLACGIAWAYPGGWTSDITIPGVSNATSLDMAANGDFVHVVYLSGGQIYYVRSDNGGVSWGTPVAVTSGTATRTYPSVCASTGGGVFIGWVSSERAGAIGNEALFRRSLNNGGTWEPGLWAYTAAPDTWRQVSFLSATRTAVLYPAFCYQRRPNDADVYTEEIAIRIVQPDGSLGAETWVSQVDHSAQDRWDSQYGRVDSSGTDYMVVYVDSDPYITSNPKKVQSNRWDGTDHFATVASGADTTHDMQYPDVGWGTSTYWASWTDKTATQWMTKCSDWSVDLWLTARRLYVGTSANPSYAKIMASSTYAAYRNEQGTEVWTGPSYVEPIPLMKACNPQSGDRSISTTFANGHTYLAASGTDGRIRTKKTDDTFPTATLNTDGSEHDGTVYVKPVFNINFVNVTDGWNVTDASGATNDGIPFVNGVTRILVQSNDDEYAPWLDEATILAPNPWSVTVNNKWSDGTTFYLQSVIRDVAGREYTTPQVKCEVDGGPPVCTMNTDTTANSNGWRNADTTVTVTGLDDHGLQALQYRTHKGDATAWGAWQEYSSPVIFSDGEWYVQARAIDWAGNTETVEKQVFVDTKSPTATVTRPEGTSFVTDLNGKYRLGGNANDTNMYKASIWLDGVKVYETNEYFNMAYVADFTNKPEKIYTVEVKAEDRAGNTVTSTSKRSTLVKGDTLLSDWYFAEGTTRANFDEWLCVYNPEKNDATVSFQFLNAGSGGKRGTGNYTVKAGTRSTFNVRELAGNGLDVAARVHSEGAAVIVERPMYFNWNGITGGTTALGANVLQKTYYFAEGTTRGGFQEYLCLANFGSANANVTVTYMLGNGENIPKTYVVGAGSRKTINVNGEVGPEQDVSMKVESDQTIAAERPMYFNYHGQTDGSIVVGTTGPATEWYFAEGCTQPGFDEWLSVQNPNNKDAAVTFKFMLGTGKNQTANVTVPARSRQTYNVRTWVAEGNNVSVKVTSTNNVPVVAERPMYFNYKGAWTGGHDNIGLKTLSDEWYIAEGTTRSGFEEWITIMNPSINSCGVHLYYMDNTGIIWNQIAIANPKSRLTVDVNAEINKNVGPNKDISVYIVTDVPVAVERPMYFNYNGVWTGGHIGWGFCLSD